MRKSKYTESQIIAILKEVENGMKVADVCRQHGIIPGQRPYTLQRMTSTNCSPDASESGDDFQLWIYCSGENGPQL